MLVVASLFLALFVVPPAFVMVSAVAALARAIRSALAARRERSSGLAFAAVGQAPG